jgi:uncharacterized protein
VNIKNSTCLRFFLVTVLLAGPSLPAQVAKSAAATKHCLWKVQTSANTVYLLGSVHVLKKQDYPLPAPIEAAFTNTSIAVFETDIGAMEKPEVAMKLLTKGQLPAGQTLRDQLSAPLYASFSNYVAKTGMPLQMFDSLTPAMAAITLVALEFKKMGLDPEQGLDLHFFTRAQESGKKVIPLETLDFQISLLTDFTKEEGELLMKATLKDIETTEKDFDDLLTAWKTGDAAKLDKLLNEAMQETPVIYQRMISDRNRNWLPKIEELIRGKDKAIVIVGAGHLVGPTGIVELLRKKGYRVTQE